MESSIRNKSFSALLQQNTFRNAFLTVSDRPVSEKLAPPPGMIEGLEQEAWGMFLSEAYAEAAEGEGGKGEGEGRGRQGTPGGGEGEGEGDRGGRDLRFLFLLPRGKEVCLTEGWTDIRNKCGKKPIFRTELSTSPTVTCPKHPPYRFG